MLLTIFELRKYSNFSIPQNDGENGPLDMSSTAL